MFWLFNFMNTTTRSLIKTTEQGDQFFVELVLNIERCLDVVGVHDLLYCTKHLFLITIKPVDLTLHLLKLLLMFVKFAKGLNSEPVSAGELTLYLEAEVFELLRNPLLEAVFLTDDLVLQISILLVVSRCG
jgi:hypothetical protein